MILLKDGAIGAQGGYTELRERHARRARRARRPLEDGGIERQMSNASGGVARQKAVSRRRRWPRATARRRRAQGGKGGQLVKEEARATGSVSGRVMAVPRARRAARRCGCLLITMLCFDRAFLMGTDSWLALWTSADAWGGDLGATASWPPPEQLSFWMPVYVGLALGCGVAVYLRSVLTRGDGARACAKLYAALSDAVFGAPTSFFDSTPSVGSSTASRRHGADGRAADAEHAVQWLNCVMPVIGTLCLIAVVSPVFLAWVLPLVVLYLARRVLLRAGDARPAAARGDESLAHLLAVLRDAWRG